MKIKLNATPPSVMISLPNGCTILQSRHPQTNELVSESNYLQVVRAVVGDSQIQAGIVAAVQRRLDDFARTRNYDSMLSLCTYASSANVRFSREGQYGVQARDSTWARLYEVMDEVQTGARTMPITIDDIEQELPVLEWPT